MINTLILALLLSVLCAAGYIRSGPISVQYGYSGQPVSFLLPFSLENGISMSDQLLVIWPQLIHSGTSKTAIKVSLLTEDGDLLSATNVLADSILTNSHYYISFGVDISPTVWYEVKIEPAITPTLTTGFVQLSTVSDYLSTNKIIYDSNLAYGYYFIQSVSGGLTSTVIAAVSSPDPSDITVASKIYYLYIDVTPSISSANGGNFTVALYYDPIVHTTGSLGLMDFQFVGTCQSEPACPTCTAAVLNSCNIDGSLQTITFTLSTVSASETIRIQTEVQNPIYLTVRGIQVFWADAISGIIQENGQIVNALSVSAIPLIDLGSDRVYFLWGLSAGYSDSDTSGINIGVYAAESTSPLIGPMNSFNIGFKIQDTSPIDSVFNVHVNLFAQGVLQGSIVHNLPSTSNSSYCSYTYPTITCTNVGSFIDQTTRYFISGKAYYDSTTPTTLAGFGDVTIESVVYDDFGNLISGVSLFSPLVSAVPISVATSTQFLDLTGIHSSSKAVRYAQVVSYADDYSRSSLGNAIMGFTQGNSSTVGVVPNLNTSQQLIFLLNVPQAKMSTLTMNNQYEMKLLYNSHVIGFQTGTQGLGLDFAGWSATTNNWTIQSAPCYQTNKVVTQKYFDNFTGSQIINTQTTLEDASNNPLYGIYRFRCGQSAMFTAAQASTLCSGDCVDECQLFQGFSYTDLSSGVISMRRVTFPAGYHSPLYADPYVLDFVLVFMNGGTVVSSSLINAYTIQAAQMANIKAAYVNYFDDTVKSNKGVRIPMLVRLGGAALANESRGADTVAIFFDQNTQSISFQDSGTYTIGCSTGNCIYYPNPGVVKPQDIWHSSDRVEFHNIPTLLIEFNLLVPATQQLGTAPSSMTIAFLSSNYTVYGVNNLLQVLSVFRLFGPVVSSSIASSIPNINGLAPITPSTLNVDFNDTSWLSSSVSAFSYAIDTTLITNTPQNNTVYSMGTPVSLNVNNNYGAGITITSFYYNIFSSVYLQSITQIQCTYLWYNYWEQEVGKNIERTGKAVHTMYCPVDSSLNLATSQGNVVLLNPQYPSNFVSGFPLQTVLAYGLSSPQGMLLTYRLETNAIGLTWSCVTLKLTPYYPNSPGKQRSTFTLSFNPITLAPSPMLYSSFMINLQLPATTVPSTSTLSILTTVCDSLDTRLSCSIIPISSLSFNIQFTLISSQSIVISQLNFNVYGISSAAFGSASNYTLIMYLPQSSGAVLQVFGPDYTTECLYATCTAPFTTSLTASSSLITLTNLTLETISQDAKGAVSYILSFDYRQAFFSTSILQLHLGFLQSPSTWRTRGDMLCSIYQIANGTTQISTLWQSMDYTTYPILTLTPKAQILLPNTHILNVVCNGGAIPDTVFSSQPIEAVWLDNALLIESSVVNLTYPTGMLVSSTFTPIIVRKRFNTPGMMAYYTFSIVLNTAITTQSRFYVQLPCSLPTFMNNNKQIECYMRTSDNPSTNDVTSIQSLCQVYERSRLVIYTSIAAASGTTLYLDVFNVEQPLTINIASSFISIVLDLDSNFTNGIYQYGEVAEITPSTAAVTSLSILNVIVTPLQLQTVQNITILFSAPTSTFSTARRLYFVLPAGYTPSNSRGISLIPNITCSVIDTLLATPVDMVQTCIFISRRIIGIDVSTTATGINFQLIIQGLISPSSVSDQFQNSLQFNLMLVTDTTETIVSFYTLDQLFSSVSILDNPNTISLEWYSNQQSLTSTDNVLIVYMGYYRNWFELRSQNYPLNYQTSFNFTISNFNPLTLPIMPISYEALGTISTLYRMVADPNLASPLLYTLQFSKANDTNNIYSMVPSLKVVVSTAQCILSTLQSVYTIAIGGTTLPIIINASQCIPLQSINISMGFSAYASQLGPVPDLSNFIITSQSQDGLYYLAVMHTPHLLLNNTNITLSFTITGPQSVYYSTIPSVTLTSVSMSYTSAVPVAVLPNIVSPTNSSYITFQLQCSTPSTIYWAVGLTPNIVNTTALDIQARIISGGNGYVTNFTQPNDPYFRAYGVTYTSAANSLINQTVSSLKSNSAYQFRYFCMDQLSRPSEAQTINFTSYNTNASLMKLQILFNNLLTYGQINDLVCSLAQNLNVEYTRVMTSAISTCYVRNLIFYPSLTTPLIEQPLAQGVYSYAIYILPDYTLNLDTTNADIKNQLTNTNFLSNTLTSTANSSLLPWMISLSTQDISYDPNILPTMSILTIQPTQTGVIVSATLANMNGFIVVAMMRGLFYSNLTKPSQVNIKQGLFNDITTLDAVQMQYASIGSTINFTITTLQNSTDYSCYYYATVDDPQLSALASPVSVINITTASYYIITVDWSARLVIAVLSILLFLI